MKKIVKKKSIKKEIKPLVKGEVISLSCGSTITVTNMWLKFLSSDNSGLFEIELKGTGVVDSSIAKFRMLGISIPGIIKILKRAQFTVKREKGQK
jgi:hypothetical protein